MPLLGNFKATIGLQSLFLDTQGFNIAQYLLMNVCRPICRTNVDL